MGLDREAGLFHAEMTGPDSFKIDGHTYSGKPSIVEGNQALGAGTRVAVAFTQPGRRMPVIVAVTSGTGKRHAINPYDFNPSIVVFANWWQSEGSVRKNSLGVYASVSDGGLAQLPSAYSVLQSYTSAVGEITVAKEGAWPHGIGIVSDVRVLVRPIFTATAITGYEVAFYRLSTEQLITFQEEGNPGPVLDFLALTAAGDANSLRCLGNSLLYLNELEHTGSLTVLQRPTYDSTFLALAIDITNLQSAGTLNSQSNTLDTLNELGASNVSVSDTVMIQASIGYIWGGVRLWNTADYLEWIELMTTDWQDLLAVADPAVRTGDHNGEVLWLNGVKISRRTNNTLREDAPVYWYPAGFSNNSPSRFRDAQGAYGPFHFPVWMARKTDWRIPSWDDGALAAISWATSLWNVRVNGDGTFSAAEVSGQPALAEGAATVLSSVINDYNAKFLALFNTGYYDSSYLPGLEPQVDTPKYYEFTCDLIPESVQIGKLTVEAEFHGATLTRRFLDPLTPDYNYYPPLPLEEWYRGTYIPLPLTRPNAVEPPEFSRCKWLGWKSGETQSNFRLVRAEVDLADVTPDPQIALTSTGRTVQVALRPIPVVVPQIENPALTPEYLEHTQTNVGGYPGVQGEVRCESSGELFPTQSFPGQYYYGDNYIKIGWSWTPTGCEAVHETVLIIGSQDGNSHLIVPICGRFTGTKFPGWWHPDRLNSDPLPAPVTVTEELPVPENVWQIAITGDDRILVLMDYRPSFEASPRPCLRCYDLNGTLVAEYLDLIDPDIQAEVYASDITGTFEGDPYTIHAGSAKWFFHGRHNTSQAAGKHITLFDSEVPGPRMKVTWPGMDGQNPRAGDTMVFVSCECWERKDGDAYSFKSRVEHRILRLTANSFVEVLAQAEEHTNTVTAGNWPQDSLTFPSTLPRPATLTNMAAGGDWIEHVHQDSLDPTLWALRRKTKP